MRFLFVDRILELSPGSVTRGIKHITPEDYYLSHDESGKLCFIPSLIGETLGQLAAWNVMQANDFSKRPVAGVVNSATLHRPAFVGETLVLESIIDTLDEVAVRYHSTAYVGNEKVFSIDGAIGPLLPMEDFIAKDQVIRQFAEINRPGIWSMNTPHSYSHGISAKYEPGVAYMEFDRIIASEINVSMCAEKYITRAAPYFADHFPNKPVLPLTVLLECKINLAHHFLKTAHFPHLYHISELRKIKMSDFVYPGDVVTCYLSVKLNNDKQLILALRSEVAGERVCVLEMVLTAKV